jgi:hypothetical protein
MNIDIEIAIGANSSSMGPVTVKRLERKGLIEVSRYYRARIVRIVATGKETAPPPNERTDLPRADRGTHCDGPLLTALVELGVPEHVADLMLGSGLPGWARSSVWRTGSWNAQPSGAMGFCWGRGDAQDIQAGRARQDHCQGDQWPEHWHAADCHL